MEQQLVKTAFLSYYISMYNVVNESLGYENLPVTVEEIYDFIHDIKTESNKTTIPDIKMKDIAFCLYVLNTLGICRSSVEQ
jgi:hypothetical protein